MSLVHPRERTLFWIVLCASAVFWLALVVGTVGIALVYMLFFLVGYLFAQSGFISYVRGTGVEISPDQLPELYDRIQQCCVDLEMQKVPLAYVLNAHGLLNALATRFLRRHYVVLFSDVVDALADRPDALNFYIGHELGHIRRGHLAWAWFLAPGRFLPLVGTAYSRAREYTCDLHGLACCPDKDDAAYGLAVLAAGEHGSARLDVAAFADQSDQTGGFWMSFHELTGDYPWLTKRMRHLLAVASGRRAVFPRRHALAWLLALFVPRIGVAGGGGAGGVLVMVMVVGIVAAIALPNFLRFEQQAKLAPAREMREQVVEKASAFIGETGHMPASLSAMGMADDASNAAVAGVAIDGQRFVLALHPSDRRGGSEVVLTPYMEAGELHWDCASDLDAPFDDFVCSDAPVAAESPLGAMWGDAMAGGGAAAAGDSEVTFAGREEYMCGAEFRESEGYRALEPGTREQLRQHCNEWKLRNL